VPRYVARLVSRIVAQLVVDYFVYVARLGASARRAAHRLSSTTWPTPRVWVPQHVARLVSRIVSRLVVDYFASAERPGVSARRAACPADRRAALRRLLRLRFASGCLGMLHGSSSTTSPTPRVWVPRHVAQLIACHRLLCLRRAAGCLGTSRGSSRGSLRHSSSTTSPTPHVLVPQHVTRPVTRLIVDCSVRRDFVLRPRWLYFSHAVRRDYLSRGNTGSTSSTPRAATMSSSGRIASTIHLN
jgi:hypothetical protein